MQEVPTRRSNRDRTAATRRALMDAARTLFADKGYADTGTPEIVAKAAVTRGALYHHFADKAHLLGAIIEAEATAVAGAIDAATATIPDPLDALAVGASVYFEQMSEPGRARLLLVEGPVVLGASRTGAIDRETGGRSMLQGLQMAADAGCLVDAPLPALADLLSAAFDRAALAIADGAAPAPYHQAIRTLLESLRRQ